MGRVLIIGAGGVGTVVVNKIAQVPEVFTDIMLASRTKSKCNVIAADVKKRFGVDIKTDEVEHISHSGAQPVAVKYFDFRGR